MPQVDIKYVKNLIQIGLAQGYERSKLLALCGFDFDPMVNTESQTKVSAEQYSSLSNHIAALLQDECFGFYNDYTVPCGTFQMMCYAILPCRTLHAAIIRMNRFAQMCASIRGELVSSIDPFTFDPQSELVSYSDPHLTNKRIHVAFRSQYAISATLSSWHRFCGWLIGTPIKLSQVNLEGHQEVDAIETQRYFKCPLAYNQPANSLTFDRCFLGMPLRQNEASLEAFLKLLPYHLGPERDIEEKELKLEQKVRSAIGYNFSIAPPSFNDIADSLSLSPRTLRRQLERVGKTYRQILEEKRKEAVLTLLARPELKLNAIAALMGFDEPSAFHRAFKNWFGTPPGKYRLARWGKDNTPEIDQK